MVFVKNIPKFEIWFHFGISKFRFLELIRENNIKSKKNENENDFIKRIRPQLSKLIESSDYIDSCITQK